MNYPTSTTNPQINEPLPLLKQPVIGIDMGGTKINAAIIPAEGDGRVGMVQSVTSAATPHTAGEFIQTLVEMVERLKTETNASLVGISTAGVVDSITGTVLGSTGNMPALSRLPNLKAELESRIGLPVHIENDANAAAYGEWRAGAAKGASNMFAITLGTGVGMGLVLHQQLYRGSHYFAAEGGHIAITYTQERKCTCGRWDCWEAFASGTGLKTTAQLNIEAASEPIQQEFLKKYCPDNEPITTYTVIAAWKDKHPLGIKIMDEWHNHIAVGLGSLINVLDPDMIVVGGGLCQFVDFDLLFERTKKRSLTSNFKLLPATLGNYAGLVGAAYLAVEATQHHVR